MRDEEMNIPHLFRCPISLDLFEDPVTLCTGQTYDRSSIERWLKAGNLTCPVTMQKLQDPSLVPNHTLQHLIHHWLCMDNRFSPEDDPVYTFDSDLSLVVLKHDIESRESTFKTRIEALRRIRSLSEELEWRKTRLVKLGFFEAILKLVFSLVEPNLCREDSDIAEESLHCVLNLLPCIEDMRPLDMLKESSHLATFQVLLEQGSKKMKMNLCSFIEASLKTREICSVLGQTQSLVRGLLHLVSGNAETAEAANKAVLALCSLESNRDCFIKEGAVDSLVLHLANFSRRNQTSVPALTTLELLLESDTTARNDLIENPNGVRILVKMVFGVCFDHKGSESAVSSLLSVCYESAKARDAAISAGVLTQLLLLLQSQCSSRAKNKGRVLLKLLRST